VLTKKIKDLKKGDVIHTQYGDYDNWVTVTIVKDVELFGSSWKMTVTGYSKEFEMYAFSGEEEIEIIELGKKINKKK
jgi:hypothetical protein